jgi:ubiquinone/menaquinone biosynthesis C-methylase UbiE
VRDPGYVETFNRIAPVYDEKHGRSCEPAHRFVVDWAAGAGLQPRTVLDIGCGTGRLLKEVHGRWPGSRLWGVDPAEGMIEQARRQIPHATLSVGRAEALPLEDSSIDLVVSTTSFGHWADQAAGLREVARVLRPGGSCLIAEHAPPGLLLKLLLMVLDRLPQLRSADEFTGLVQSAGLRLVRLEPNLETFTVVHAERIA